jgi:tripartite-type tricarboxylate transporter receptor subunit TctC
MKLVNTALTILIAACAAGAWAQAFPNRTIRYVVPFPPGGGADILSRLLGPKLSEALGQQVLIDNRGGAAGNIGTEIAAKSPPDGHTIVWANAGTHAVNPSIYSNMPFKESDFTSIVWISSIPQLVVAHPSLPVKNVKELIALDKTRPGLLNYGSSGPGNYNHLAAELFNRMAGTKFVHVPYRGGGPALVGLLGGEVAIMLQDPASLMGPVRAGKLRAIAVTSAKRALAMPDLPTVAESGVPGYEVTSWSGILAPAGTPADVVRRLNAEFNKIISVPEMKSRMLEFGHEAVGGAPELFGDQIRKEIAKWAPVVKAANIRVD